MTEYGYELEQLRSGTGEGIRKLYMGYAWVKEHGGVDRGSYYTADSGTVTARSETEACEKLYMKYNTAERPQEYKGRCMSVSDIVILRKGGEEPEESAWYCDSVGFVRLGEETA